MVGGPASWAARIRAGRNADALQLLTDMEEGRRAGNNSRIGMAMIATSLGKTERALHWLEKSVEDHEGWIAFLPSLPHLRPLRSEPGFAEILRRANLPEW